MKILFLYKSSSLNIRTPLGILYLTAALKKQGHECRFFLADLEFKLLPKIKTYGPDVICYSTTTGFHRYYLQLNCRLKEQFDFYAVFGGPHATFFPNDLIKEDGVDAICLGEGEEALCELLEKRAAGKSYTDTANFWFKEKDGLIKNPVRLLFGDLDSITFPDRSFLDQYRELKRYGKIDVLISRGCPFNCTYCFNHQYKELYHSKGAVVRTRSPENVIQEILEFKNSYPLHEIYFVDDIFPFQVEWVEKFIRLYKEQISLPFYCHLHPSLVKKEIVDLLKEAGCYAIWMGIESGNEKIRREVLKRKVSNDQIISSAKTIKDNGIVLFTFNMVGIPHETIDTAFETLDLNIACRTDYAWVSILQPYPKTEILQIAKEGGFLPEDYQISELYHSDTPLKLSGKREFINLHYLLPVTVTFPSLRKLARKLVEYPLTPCYMILYYLHKIVSYLRFKQELLSLSLFQITTRRFLKRFID